jgi:hypothetical protein
MATVRVRIAILTVRITLSVCPFNRMAHTANTHLMPGTSQCTAKPPNSRSLKTAPTISPPPTSFGSNRSSARYCTTLEPSTSPCSLRSILLPPNNPREPRTLRRPSSKSSTIALPILTPHFATTLVAWFSTSMQRFLSVDAQSSQSRRRPSLSQL